MFLEGGRGRRSVAVSSTGGTDVRIEAPPLVGALLAFATAIAQYLAVLGKIHYDRWPLIHNPNRQLRLAYVAALCLVGTVALVIAVNA